MILNLAIIPLREPERVELRARFGGEITPTRLESRLADAITVPTRYPPHIAVEELDGDEVVVKIVVTPERPADGGRLADGGSVRRAQRRRVRLPARDGRRVGRIADSDRLGAQEQCD